MAEEQLQTFEEISDSLNDFERRVARWKATPPLKDVLLDEIVPFFRSLLKTTDASIEEQAEALEEFVSEEGSVIYPELAGPLFGLIELAKNLGAAVLEGRGLDDASKQLAQSMVDTAAILENMAHEALVADEDDLEQAAQVAEETSVAGEEAGSDEEPDDEEAAGVQK